MQDYTSPRQILTTTLCGYKIKYASCLITIQKEKEDFTPKQVEWLESIISKIRSKIKIIEIPMVVSFGSIKRISSML